MSSYSEAVARKEKAIAVAKQASDPITCPMCENDLDTGYECTGCGFDATPTLEGTCRMIPQPEVQQVDRDAAADLLGGAAPVELLEGRQDTLSLVRTLARHRAAAFEAGRAEGMREAAEVLDCRAEEYRKSVVGLKLVQAMFADKMRVALIEEAKAIRALSKEPTK